VSGAWIGGLTALEPYRPAFTVATLFFLGFAFYRVYRKKPEEQECKPGSYCASPRRERINKTTLWIMTAIIAGLLSLPYLLPYVPSENGGQVSAASSRVSLAVDNMTCSSCVVTVRRSLTRLDGVKEARVTLRPPRAVVVFDPRETSTEELVEATTKAGYPSRVEKDDTRGE
jgi:mercuric transport protein